MDFQALETELVEKFVAAINAIPRAHAHVSHRTSASHDRGFDFMVEAAIDGIPLNLAVEVKRSAFPRDVRESVWQLRNWLTHNGQETGHAVLIAETISPGARDALRSEGIGYFDNSGSLYLAGERLFVLIDRPAPKKARNLLGSIFKGRRAAVLHTMFAASDTWFGVTELAAQSRTSPTTASETLIALERFEWVETKGAGPTKERRLTRRSELLDAWVKDIAGRKPPVTERFYVSGNDDIAHRLASACNASDANYAITGVTAAQYISPFLTSVGQVTSWLDGTQASQAALFDLGARPVTEGANLIIMRGTPGIDFQADQAISGVWLASPLQVYLDMVRTGGGRAKEMAEHFRHEVLRA